MIDGRRSWQGWRRPARPLRRELLGDQNGARLGNISAPGPTRIDPVFTLDDRLADQKDANHTGLIQRGLIVIYWSWIIALGLHLVMDPHAVPATSP